MGHEGARGVVSWWIKGAQLSVARVEVRVDVTMYGASRQEMERRRSGPESIAGERGGHLAKNGEKDGKGNKAHGGKWKKRDGNTAIERK